MPGNFEPGHNMIAEFFVRCLNSGTRAERFVNLRMDRALEAVDGLTASIFPPPLTHYR